MTESDTHERWPLLLARAALGGLLLGLANLVPGFSGGMMLLAAGVYPAFVGAISELSRLHLRVRPLALVGIIGGVALIAMFLLAGWVRALLLEHRWLMYSLFIGLSLGGVPLLWRQTRPQSCAVWAGAGVGLALMFILASMRAASGGAGPVSWPLYVLGGAVAASAMLLPGIDGNYLLLLLGQYERILGAVERLRVGVFAQRLDAATLLEALRVLAPFALGVGLGVIGVSNLLRWLLLRHARPTLGALLGLLLGAVVGLWPFQEGRPPLPGERLGEHVLSAEEAARIPPEEWPLVRFDPSAAQAAIALALAGTGLAVALGISRLGGERAHSA